jgi:hypothetical protein
MAISLKKKKVVEDVKPQKHVTVEYDPETLEVEDHSFEFEAHLRDETNDRLLHIYSSNTNRRHACIYVVDGNPLNGYEIDLVENGELVATNPMPDETEFYCQSWADRWSEKKIEEGDRIEL